MQKLFLLFLLFPLTIFSQTNPCNSFHITPGPKVFRSYSPDSSQFFINKQDKKGVFQIFIGTTKDTALKCISLTGPASKKRKWKSRNKLQVQWDRSGKFLICAVEWDNYNELHYVPYHSRLGLL